MTSALLLWAIATLAADQQPPRDIGRRATVSAPAAVISGRVIVMDSMPPAPIRRARVSLSADHLKQPEITDTDVEGRYRFDGLAPGLYRITVSKPGFVTLEAAARQAGDRPPPVEVGSGVTLTVDVALPTGAAIEGRIHNEDGDPLQNATVAAVRFEQRTIGHRSIVVRQTRTDDLGRYRLHSLPEGEYFVEVSPDPRELAGDLVPPGERPPGLARTFFPGTVQPHEARAVILKRGQQFAGANFTAAAVPLVRISGRVLTSAGTPSRQFSVRLHPIDAPISTVAGILSPEGVFEFRAVPVGEYWVTASLVTSPSAPAEFSATRMRFAQDVQDLSLTTTPGTVLNGRIEAESGTLPRLTAVIVETVPSEFELPPTRPPAPRITPRPDGTFTINGLFGPNRFRLEGLPSGWEVKRVLLDQQDITSFATDFRGSNAPRPLRIIIAPER